MICVDLPKTSRRESVGLLEHFVERDSQSVCGIFEREMASRAQAIRKQQLKLDLRMQVCCAEGLTFASSVKQVRLS